MKTITNLIFIALLFVTASLSAQEHGPVLGSRAEGRVDPVPAA